MKNIVMDYPIGSTNELYDGKPHNINPIRLGIFTIGDREFYIMDYLDRDYNCECTTLLTEINGVFVKVPLSNYDLLEQLFAGVSIKPISIDVLPQKIAVCQMVQTETLMAAKNKKTPEHDLNIYIPYNVRFNPANVNGRLFSSSGLIYQDGNQEYGFNKLSDNGIFNGIISRNLQANKQRLDAKQTFVLEISKVQVPPGTTGFIRDKENRILEQLIVPGIYNLRVLVTPCINNIKDHKVLECYDCSVDAPAREYRDLHDIDRAFRGGYLDRLDMKFDGIRFEKTKSR